MTCLTETQRRPARLRLASPGALFALWRQRRVLARLDARTLDDIGVSREEARREARRPAWDVPRGWTC